MRILRSLGHTSVRLNCVQSEAGGKQGGGRLSFSIALKEVKKIPILKKFHLRRVFWSLNLDFFVPK